MTRTFHVTRHALRDRAEILAVIDAAIRQTGTLYFLVGAAARDLVLEHIHNTNPYRATEDVDVAVCVSDWNAYERIAGTFVTTHGFERLPGREHRFVRGPYIVDLVPFGALARADLIEWPESERVMSVAGFEEVHAATIEFVVTDRSSDAASAEATGTARQNALRIPVASLEGVGLLKLLAWHESPHTRPQDPVDLCIILREYEAVSEHALYEHHTDLLDDPAFDTRVAAARIFGRAVGSLVKSNATLAPIHDMLGQERTVEKFARAMGRDCGYDYTTRINVLHALATGLRESHL